MLSANKLLIDESPLQFQPSLACAIGVNEAIFLQQLHYWLKRSNNWRDGRKWCYKSVDDWQKEFPFWSTATIKRIKTSLKKQDLILEGVFNRAGFDRTKWYSINYSALEHMSQSNGSNCTNGTDQNEPSMSSNCTNGTAQFDPTNTNRLHNRILQENTHENNTVSGADQETIDERFEKLWALYPRKERKPDARKAYKRAIKKGVTDETIKAGIESYIKQVKFERREYSKIAQGGTWFNQERWEDEYSAQNTSDLGDYSRKGEYSGLW